MALGSTSANNPFLNFARYIFIVADVIKFGIQSNVQGMLIFSTENKFPYYPALFN